jgi:tRNA(fMet)-specific endonuclease VapC
MYLLDTNICIALMKGEAEARRQIRNFAVNEIGLPAIVVAELAFGAWKAEFAGRSLANLEEVLKVYKVIPFDEAAAMQYGRIRSEMQKAGTPIGPNDYLIAAITLALDATLITRNVREFERIPGLRWITF